MLPGHDRVWKFIGVKEPIVDRSVNITIDLFLGYLKNNTTWYSAEEYSQVNNSIPIPWHNVVVTIWIDDTVIYSGSPTSLLTVTHNFQDGGPNEFRVFRIEIQGLTNDHNTLWPETNDLGGAALRVQGHIDHIPLSYLMYKFAKYIVDDGSSNVATETLRQNGSQILTINTPFYSWLHQHREPLTWHLKKSTS
jgi:hypothetical protein